MALVSYVDEKKQLRVLDAPIEIGRIPMMLRSRHCVLYGKSDADMMRMGECPMDPGGYFIIRGQERVILIQEQVARNKIVVDREKDSGVVTATVVSMRVEIKSRTIVVWRKGKMYLQCNRFTDEIPLTVAMRAYGVETVGEMMDLLGGEESIRRAFSATAYERHRIPGTDDLVMTQEDALHYIGSRTIMWQSKTRTRASVIEDARQALSDVVLSHIPPFFGDFRLKAILLGVMARLALSAANDSTLLDNRDFFGNKCFELAGDLLSLLFENVFKNLCSSMRHQADLYFKKAKQNSSLHMENLISQNIISNGMKHAIGTGNWRLPRFRMDRAGVTEILSRLSYMNILGMMGRIRAQFEKTRKISGPRSLQPSQWGLVCPSDTPEGETCGLVKNLALLAHITHGSDEARLIELALSLGTEDARHVLPEALWDPTVHRVFVNGTLVGVHRAAEFLTTRLRSLRRKGTIDSFVSISISEKHRSVHILSEKGRLCRPLIVVDPSGMPLIQPSHCQELARGLRSFDDCVADGLVEFLDVCEEDNMFLAVYEREIVPGKTTHLEIEPMTILGIVAGLIPYPDHNQSPRNTYQCAMGKQSMGAIASNQMHRMDTALYLLAYPQKPLVTSRTMNLVGFENLPAGHNAIVAVMSFSGYDIEDALIMNQASIDRGFGRCIFGKTFPHTVKAPDEAILDEGEAAKFGKPQNNKKTLQLDVDGIVAPGTVVKPKEAIFEKKVKSAQGQVGISSSSYKGSASGVVHQVLLSETEDGTKVVKVNVQNIRTPEVGDKFSSRHGQKGIVGLIVPQEDMPFTDEGIVPDLIMNPHGFPSRMTVGKMLELLGSKAAVLDGKFRDGSAFCGDPVEPICDVLLEHGFHYHGKDYLTSGITGEPLESYIFFGPVYYQKLKHMVFQKLHARAKGPVAMMTRQPTGGRSRDGGLRLGEMERDCLISYGASNLIIERLMLSSDAYATLVCQKCGLLAYKKHENKELWCNFCQDGSHVVTIVLPYAFKLLLQELTSMGILPRLMISE